MKFDDIKKLVAASEIPHAKAQDDGYRVRVSIGQLEVDIYEADDAEVKLQRFIAWVWKFNAAAITSPQGHVDAQEPARRKLAVKQHLLVSIQHYEKEFGEAFGRA